MRLRIENSCCNCTEETKVRVSNPLTTSLSSQTVLLINAEKIVESPEVKISVRNINISETNLGSSLSAGA